MKKAALRIRLLTAFLAMASTFAFSQKGIDDGSTYGHGQDSINCIRNLSLFSEFYKHNNYKDAIGPWRQVFNECPSSREGIYAYGIIMFKSFLEEAKDPALKAAYCDTIMMIHERRIKYFKNEGRILGSEGIDLLRYRRNDGPQYVKKGYDLLKRSIELEKERSSATVLTLFVTTSISLNLDKQITAEQAVNDYVMVNNLIEAMLNKIPSSKLKEAKAYNDKNIKDSRILTCENIKKIFEPKYPQNKDNMEYLKLMSEFLVQGGCEDDDFFATISERLYELAPNSESAYNLARLFYKRKDYEKAKSYYLEAIKGSSDNENKANYYYELGIIYTSYLKQPQEAVDCADEALKLKPNWGEPYILKGQAYILGKNSYSDSFDQQTVFWVAVDQFIKAKSIDPSVEEKASSQISEYSKYFPTKEDVFFRTLAVGDSYTVKGWINKTTTVRAR